MTVVPVAVAAGEVDARGGKADGGVLIASVEGAVDVGEGDVDGVSGEVMMGVAIVALVVGGVYGIVVIGYLDARYGLAVGVGDGAFDVIGGFGSPVFDGTAAKVYAHGCGGQCEKPVLEFQVTYFHIRSRVVLVEEFPSEAEVEAELLGGVAGDDAVGLFLEVAVEVSGFGVDAGAFDLQVDEEVGPDVVAHFNLVLAVEDA